MVYLLQRAHSQRDKAGITVRIMFFDFFSAFNTIQTTHLYGKLQKMQVDASTGSWIIDYLMDRLQSPHLALNLGYQTCTLTAMPRSQAPKPGGVTVLSYRYIW